MNRQSYIIYNKVRVWMGLLLLAVVLGGCTDTLFDGIAVPADTGDGIQFGVTTIEQNAMTIGIGRTRGAVGDSAAVAQGRQADHYMAHPVEGSAVGGLHVVRMPLPFMEIHEGVMSAPAVPQAAADSAAGDVTRAPLSEIVNADGTNFHDSLSIWGCVYNGAGQHRFLFSQTLLKRIRNWRTSVHWPYENTTQGDYGQETACDAWKGEYMRFCAVSPALESMNMLMLTPPKYDSGTLTPPTFKYTLPETVDEMRDLLFGSSAPVLVDVQAGPQGDGTQKEENLSQDNKTVNLTFQHALTALRFAVGTLPEDMGITVKKIKLSGVYTQGTFDPAGIEAATGTQGAWSSVGVPASASYELAAGGSESDSYETKTGSTGVYIDNSQVMFMIPHAITEEAKLEVEIEVPRRKYKTKDGNPRVPDGLEDTPKSHTVSCSLKGDVWKKGYTVTYLLTIGEVEDGYYLLAEAPEAQEHSDSPISKTFPVHSYRSYWDYAAGEAGKGEENTTHAVNWKVAGYSTTEPTEGTDFSDPEPDWLTIGGINSGEKGVYVGGNGSQANFTISAQSFTKAGKHSEILGRHTAYGTGGETWDLSKKTPNGEDKVTEETANCYIVNRMGDYSFPLVYGNKALDGAEDDCFVDHTGAVISKREIEDQMKAKTTYENIEENVSRKVISYTWSTTSSTLRAVVLWQDVSDLISITSLSTLNQPNYISFQVKKSTPGNAVIALQGKKVTEYQKSADGGETWTTETSKGDSGYEYGDWETLWTWHIWVTDEVYANQGEIDGVKDDYQFLNSTEKKTQHDHIVSLYQADGTTEVAKILPVNLGWVPDEDDFVYYSHREVWVKLQQTEAPAGGTPLTSVVKIEQHARQPLITGTSTVYQWGRPTALPMVATTANVKRAIYDGSGNNITDQFAVATVSGAGDHITQTTSILRKDAADNGNSTWFDYTEKTPHYWSTTKTVYDPCPAGFYVPEVSIFTGLSRTGGKSDDGTGLNMYKTVEDGVSPYTHTDGRATAGGYFYTTKFTDDATLTANRYQYNQVYFPVTKEWQGDVDAGTSMFDAKTNNNFGFYWCSDWVNEENKKGVLLWLIPSWDYKKPSDSDKPAIQFGREMKYSSAQPIRPTGSLPATTP